MFDHLRELANDHRDVLLRKLAEAISLLEREHRLSEHMLATLTSAQERGTSSLMKRRAIAWAAAELLDAMAESKCDITELVRLAADKLRRELETI